MMESTGHIDVYAKRIEIASRRQKGMTRQDSAIDAQMDLDRQMRAIYHCKWIPQPPESPDLLQLAVQERYENDDIRELFA